MLHALDLPKLKLAVQIRLSENSNGKWLFSLSIKHEQSKSNESSRAIFSTDQQALSAALVYLKIQSATFSPAATQATALWIKQKNNAGQP